MKYKKQKLYFQLRLLRREILTLTTERFSNEYRISFNMGQLRMWMTPMDLDHFITFAVHQADRLFQSSKENFKKKWNWLNSTTSINRTSASELNTKRNFNQPGHRSGLESSSEQRRRQPTTYTPTKSGSNFTGSKDIPKDSTKGYGEDDHQKRWVRNLTNRVIPENVFNTLALGPKFILPHGQNKIPIQALLAHIEDAVHKLLSNRQDTVRSQCIAALACTNNFQNKIKVKKQNVPYDIPALKQFIHDNPDILIMNADKGNITVIRSKTEYQSKMGSLFIDKLTYTKIRNPTTNLQKSINSLIENWKSKHFISEIQAKFLKTTSANAPRVYGLPKIHKMDTPLRPIISSIGSPA